MRTLCERSLKNGNEVYVCFVDFEKAFDRVDWVKMFEILKNFHTDWKDRRLREGSVHKARSSNMDSRWRFRPGTIGQGVRQGCPLSPLLFSISIEVMMIETLENIAEGIIVGDK